MSERTPQEQGAHYFVSQPLAEQDIHPLTVELAGQERHLVSAPGIFSPDGIDKGTAVLLSQVPPPDQRGNLLDIGCGWGALALTLALESPVAKVWAVDVNERCVQLTQRNAQLLGLSNLEASSPEGIDPQMRFSTIWSNPPIRIGKQALHELLLQWLPRLEVGGNAWLVVQKNLGADSLQQWLSSTLGANFSVQRTKTAKAFRILQVTRTAA